MNNIEIKISGGREIGKTGIVYILKEFFKEKGFEIDIKNSYNYQNEEQLNSLMGRGNTPEEIAGYIKPKSKITISEE